MGGNCGSTVPATGIRRLCSFLVRARSGWIFSWPINQLVSQTTTSIIYDRAGTGWSENTGLPRSIDEVIDELCAVLRSIDVPAPFVLVGHSLGGLYVQRYAQRFPDQVAARLLLDPAHEDWDLYMPEEELKLANQPAVTDMPELPAAFMTQYRDAFAGLFGAFPTQVRDLLVERHFEPDRFLNGFLEGANVLAMFDQLRHGGPRPNVPTIILSGAGIDATQALLADPDQIKKQIRGSEQLYAAIAASTSRGEHRILPDASHITIPLTRSDAVAQAVRDLLLHISDDHLR